MRLILPEGLFSNHQQSSAISRPTQSPHAVVTGEGAAASASDCLAIFTTTFPSSVCALALQSIAMTRHDEIT